MNGYKIYRVSKIATTQYFPATEESTFLFIIQPIFSCCYAFILLLKNWYYLYSTHTNTQDCIIIQMYTCATRTISLTSSSSKILNFPYIIKCIRVHYMITIYTRKRGRQKQMLWCNFSISLLKIYTYTYVYST